MTRRQFLSTPAAAAPVLDRQPITIPIRRLIDTRPNWKPQQLDRSWTTVWAEAVRDLARAGIHLAIGSKHIEIRRSASGRPVLSGLETGLINFVVTDWIPRDWDGGRSLSGISTNYGGYHLCMAAVNRAHGHRIPFLSVNTCVHELLHVLLEDIFEPRPKGWSGDAREFRIDVAATRLWLFHDGAAIRKGAEAYLARVKTGHVNRAQSGGLSTA